MVSREMLELGTKRSVIREIFEYGRQRKAIVGEENVFDFSLGNPNVPTPMHVNDTAIQLLLEADNNMIHAYSSAPGFDETRSAVAQAMSEAHHCFYKKENVFMTVGAAASLTITLKAISEYGDEVVVFAPYFPEYKVFIEGVGAKMVLIPPKTQDFQISFDVLEQKITAKTKAVIVNSPNNPSGVVYSKETLKELAALLEAKSRQFGHPIYLISDEPYREIVFSGVELPYIPDYYQNTIICYSYSKSLSLPGERIGYILVGDEVTDSREVLAAVAGAARVLGYVCAPSLMQRVIESCIHDTSDIAIYETNRNLLYDSLVSYGYEVVKPDGAFYLFPKALEENASAFCEKARKYDLLMVPGDGFGCPGYVRISYCVRTEMLKRSLPLFEQLAKDYGVR